MMRFAIVLLSAALSVGACGHNRVHQPVTLDFWHAMTGSQERVLAKIVEQYNHRQTRYQVHLIYKGDYAETMAAFVLAHRAKQVPALVQVPEMGRSLMWFNDHITIPVDAILTTPADKRVLAYMLPGIRHYYSRQNRLWAMPFNVSVPVLFVNKSKFSQQEVLSLHGDWQAFSERLYYLKQRHPSERCLYTSTFPAWIQLEVAIKSHPELLATATLEDWRRFLFERVHRIQQWQKQGLFLYGGRDNNALSLFTSSVCSILSQSSGSYRSLQHSVDFPIAIAPLPSEPGKPSAYHPMRLGGAAIWIGVGQSAEQYRGVRSFLRFWLQPDTQAYWVSHTGYLPIALTGPYADIRQGMPKALYDIAQQELGVGRYPNQTKILPEYVARDELDALIERVLARKRKPDQAVLNTSRRILTLARQKHVTSHL